MPVFTREMFGYSQERRHEGRVVLPSTGSSDASSRRRTSMPLYRRNFRKRSFAIGENAAPYRQVGAIP